MSLAWDVYVVILGLFLGAGGFGIAYGQFRLAIKEMFDAAGA
jgi:hypothetical protein